MGDYKLKFYDKYKSQMSSMEYISNLTEFNILKELDWMDRNKFKVYSDIYENNLMESSISDKEFTLLATDKPIEIRGSKLGDKDYIDYSLFFYLLSFDYFIKNESLFGNVINIYSIDK